jgi:hypothetical protein
MYVPEYIDLNVARGVLAEIGVHLNERQMKRAAEMDAHGKRKIPFFKDPIDGRLKIEKRKLLGIYHNAQLAAEQGSAYTVEP